MESDGFEVTAHCLPTSPWKRMAIGPWQLWSYRMDVRIDRWIEGFKKLFWMVWRQDLMNRTRIYKSVRCYWFHIVRTLQIIIQCQIKIWQCILEWHCWPIRIQYTHALLNVLLFLVSEGPQSGGEDHERSGFQQGQRGRLQWVCGVGGRADGGVQWLLSGTTEEERTGRQINLMREIFQYLNV